MCSKPYSKFPELLIHSTLSAHAPTRRFLILPIKRTPRCRPQTTRRTSNALSDAETTATVPLITISFFVATVRCAFCSLILTTQLPRHHNLSSPHCRLAGNKAVGDGPELGFRGYGVSVTGDEVESVIIQFRQMNRYMERSQILTCPPRTLHPYRAPQETG